MSEKHAELMKGYWTYYRLFTSDVRADRLAADDYFWASDRVGEILAVGGNDAFELVVAICETAPNGPASNFAGAGPIEELFNVESDLSRLVAHFDVALRTNPAVRRAFQGTWLHALPDAAAAALGKYHDG